MTSTPRFRTETHSTPVGDVHLVADGESLCGIVYPSTWEAVAKRLSAVGSLTAGAAPILDETRRQLDGYFSGERREFDLPIAMHGTPFQRRVWNALTAIPYGETRTYGEQAVKLKSPHAARAVGRADGQNPISIVVPCHRVIGKSGALTGYAGGIKAKEYLLRLERDASPRLRTPARGR